MILREVTSVLNIPKEPGHLYYLASAYSHESNFVKHLRALYIDYAAARLITEGYNLIEPITTSHTKSALLELPTGYEYWRTRDRGSIARADGVIVVKFPGWDKSVGVKDERTYSISLNKPVYYLDFFNDILTVEEVQCLI